MEIKDHIREELSDLLCRQLTGQLGEAGEKRLQQLKRLNGLEKVDRAGIIQRLRQGKEFEETEAWNDFKMKKMVKSPEKGRSLVKWGIGVVAMVLVFIGVVLLWKEGDKVAVRNMPVTQEIITPGKHRAVITMADGREVKLGDRNQALKEKNGILLHLDSTSLKYQKDENVSKELIYNTISIPVGGEYHLILADGTEVWINADSKLKFPVDFIGDKREVFLEGEAYFEVAKDRQHPFIVNTSRGAVQVLGTGFNVRDYREEAKVVTTLVNGSVAYCPEKYPEKTVVLKPGFQLEDVEGGDLQARKVDVVMYAGWKDGKYVFENTSLEEIMQVLAKWYDVAVFYKNEQVRNLHFTGDLERYESINDFLEFMEIGGNVHFSIQGKTIMIE